jgi:hypothetical protein
VAELVTGALAAARAAGLRALNWETFQDRRLGEYVPGDESEQAYKTPQEYKKYREHQNTVRIKKYAPTPIFGLFAFVLEGKIPVGLIHHKGKPERTDNKSGKFQDEDRRETRPCGDQKRFVGGFFQGNQCINKREGKAERTGRQGYQPLIGKAVGFLLGLYQFVRIAFIGLIELPVMLNYFFRFHAENLTGIPKKIKVYAEYPESDEAKIGRRKAS